MGFRESEVIELLSRIFASSDPRLILGIGDDAAIVKGSAEQILTTDIAVDGVHFKREWSSGYQIGQRVAAANIADVLSMNGRCDYLLVAASLTGDETLEWIEQLAQGIADAAHDAGAIVVGGDLSRSQTLQIVITAVGHTEKQVTRSGSQVGDSIYLSSLTGWSAAGLHLLSKGLEATTPSAMSAIASYQSPKINLEINFSLAHAMADVSDSILIQGEQMASASGVSFDIQEGLFAAIDGFGDLKSLADQVGVDIWQWILAGGEDHALLATGIDLPGYRIGRVIEGSGISIVDGEGAKKVAPVSWSHFS
jgi:thiamine-monophosphate kinase